MNRYDIAIGKQAVGHPVIRVSEQETSDGRTAFLIDSNNNSMPVRVLDATWDLHPHRCRVKLLGVGCCTGLRKEINQWLIEAIEKNEKIKFSFDGKIYIIFIQTMEQTMDQDSNSFITMEGLLSR